jgi:hypothetical protein
LRERTKVRGVLNYEKNHPPPYPLPSREGKYDGFGLMLMQFKFAIKDVSKFLAISVDNSIFRNIIL